MTNVLSRWRILRIPIYRRIFEKRISANIEDAVIWQHYWKKLDYPSPKVIGLLLAEINRTQIRGLGQWLEFFEGISKDDPQIKKWLIALAKQVTDPELNAQIIRVLARTQSDRADANETVKLLADFGITPSIRAGALIHLFVKGKIPIQNFRIMMSLFPECVPSIQIQILKAAIHSEDTAFAFQQLLELWPTELTDEVFRELVDSIVKTCPDGQEIPMEKLFLDAFWAEQNNSLRFDPAWEKSEIQDWGMVLRMETTHRRTILFEVLEILAELRQEKEKTRSELR